MPLSLIISPAKESGEAPEEAGECPPEGDGHSPVSAPSTEGNRGNDDDEEEAAIAADAEEAGARNGHNVPRQPTTYCVGRRGFTAQCARRSFRCNASETGEKVGDARGVTRTEAHCADEREEERGAKGVWRRGRCICTGKATDTLCRRSRGETASERRNAPNAGHKKGETVLTGGNDGFQARPDSGSVRRLSDPNWKSSRSDRLTWRGLLRTLP